MLLVLSCSFWTQAVKTVVGWLMSLKPATWTSSPPATSAGEIVRYRYRKAATPGVTSNLRTWQQLHGAVEVAYMMESAATRKEYVDCAWSADTMTCSCRHGYQQY